jgi:hypothetical protein
MAASCVLRTPSLTSSLGARTSSPPPGHAAADAPLDDGQIIEAGCTFTGSEIKGEPGSLHQLACPAGCKADNVVGTDDYTSDSPVCAAAVHAGMISGRGGEVTVMVEPGRPAYRGSKRNGVQSRDWGAYRGSFRFQGVPRVAPEPEVAPAPVIVDAGCTLEANEIHGEPGSVHRVSCPGGCNNVTPAGVWGSNPYSGHSRICVAAIHAGLSTDRGGEFTLILEEAKPAFRGSKSNGVESRDWGEYRVSFRLRR